MIEEEVRKTESIEPQLMSFDRLPPPTVIVSGSII